MPTPDDPNVSSRDETLDLPEDIDARIRHISIIGTLADMIEADEEHQAGFQNDVFIAQLPDGRQWALTKRLVLEAFIESCLKVMTSRTPMANEAIKAVLDGIEVTAEQEIELVTNLVNKYPQHALRTLREIEQATQHEPPIPAGEE